MNKLQVDVKKLSEKLTKSSHPTVYSALVELRTKVLKTPQGVRVVTEEGTVSKIIDVLKRNTDTTSEEYLKIINVTVSIIGNLCMDNDAREKVLQFGGVYILERYFSESTSESVQNRCCRALANLALCSRGCEVIHRTNVLSHLVLYLEKTKDKECIQTYCRALRLFGRTKDQRDKLVAKGAILLVAKQVTSEDTDIKKAAVRTLFELSKSGCTFEFTDQVVCAAAIQELVTIVSREGNTEVCRQSLQVLFQLVCHPNVRPVFGAAEGIEVFIKKFQREETQNSRLSLLNVLCMCTKESVNRAKLRTNGALVLFLEALQNSSYYQIHDRVISSLVNFIYDENSFGILLENNLVFILLYHLQRSADFECDIWTTEILQNFIHREIDWGMDTHFFSEDDKIFQKFYPMEFSRNVEVNSPENSDSMTAEKSNSDYVNHREKSNQYSLDSPTYIADSHWTLEDCSTSTLCKSNFSSDITSIASSPLSPLSTITYMSPEFSPNHSEFSSPLSPVSDFSPANSDNGYSDIMSTPYASIKSCFKSHSSGLHPGCSSLTTYQKHWFSEAEGDEIKVEDNIKENMENGKYVREIDCGRTEVHNQVQDIGKGNPKCSLTKTVSNILVHLNETLPYGKNQHACTIPAENQNACKIPAENQQACTIPAENWQACTIPAENQQACTIPAENQQACTIPAENQQACTIPAENQNACKIPAENQQACTIPAENRQACTIPAENRQACTIPAENQQACTIPAENQNACTIPAENQQACTIPAENRQACTIRADDVKGASSPTPNSENMEGNQPSICREVVISFESTNQCQDKTISEGITLKSNTAAFRLSKQNQRDGPTITENHILIILSHISHMDDPSQFLVTKETVCCLLDYIKKVACPEKRAARILSRIIQNPLCFEKLLTLNTTLLVYFKLLYDEDDNAIESSIEKMQTHVFLNKGERKSVASRSKSCLLEYSDFSFLDIDDDCKENQQLNQDQGKQCENQELLHKPPINENQEYLSLSEEEKLRYTQNEHVALREEINKGNLDGTSVKIPSEEKLSVKSGLAFLHDLSYQAESLYGRGVVSHFFHRKTSEEKLWMEVSLLFMLWTKGAIQHYLMDSGVLQDITDTVLPAESNADEDSYSSGLYNVSVRGLCFLGHIIPKLTTMERFCKDCMKSSEVNDMLKPLYESETSGCHLRQTSSTNFVLCVGDEIIRASREKLVKSSPIFEAMLTGHFAESKLTEMTLSDTTYFAANYIVHYLHGCDLRCDVITQVLHFKPTNQNLLHCLEATSLAHKYMLTELQHFLVKILIERMLDTATVCHVFQFAKIHDYYDLMKHCVKTIFLSKSIKNRMKGFRKFLLGPNDLEFIKMIREIFLAWY